MRTAVEVPWDRGRIHEEREAGNLISKKAERNEW